MSQKEEPVPTISLKRKSRSSEDAGVEKKSKYKKYKTASSAETEGATAPALDAHESSAIKSTKPDGQTVEEVAGKEEVKLAKRTLNAKERRKLRREQEAAGILPKAFKPKKEDTINETDAAATPITDAILATEESKKKKGKSKNMTKPTQLTQIPTDSSTQPSTNPPSTIAAKNRFIVFIGNLPYATTLPLLKTHFASITPLSIRHRTDPTSYTVPPKSKGFAFLEFSDYDRMKTCLKLYHHSVFDDGKNPPRKINVELTAGGGGGKSEGRKEKLRVKKERLDGQRVRRAEVEREERAKKEKKEGCEGGKAVGREEGRGKEGGQEVEAENVGMHPARRAMLDGTANKTW